MTPVAPGTAMTDARPTWDELKLARDGTLYAGKPDVWRVDRTPKPRREWLIERHEDGTPARMVWMGDNP